MCCRHFPTGVLFDVTGADATLPWTVTVHFSVSDVIHCLIIISVNKVSVTIGTMLNFASDFDGHGDGDVTCKQIFQVLTYFRTFPKQICYIVRHVMSSSPILCRW